MPESKRSVFISHSSSDQSWVEAFVQSLKRLGQDAWTDWDELNHNNNNAFEQSFERRLCESSLIVSLVTPADVNGANLFFDIGVALGMGKPLVFVRSADLEPGRIPAALRKHKILLKGSPEATAEELVHGMAA